MKSKIKYDVIILGGSYSGLAAAMALGRALNRTLVIDGEKPCNAQTPYSHNFLTQDGKRPMEIAVLAKAQVKKYEAVEFYHGFAISGRRIEAGFEIQLESGEVYLGSKLIFATGIIDRMPEIRGFRDCWGISVIHCPYCHGYEVRNAKTGILGDGDQVIQFAKLICNWTDDLTIFTNGTSMMTPSQLLELEGMGVSVDYRELKELLHINGYITDIIFNDKSQATLSALYAPRPFEQHSIIPEILGCDLTVDGYIMTNGLQETSINDIYACGDNCSTVRTLANAIATGTTAGMSASKKIIRERLNNL